ncbi:MAG: hypothetical protein ACRDJT_09715 [Actinomycetota bacterium]
MGFSKLGEVDFQFKDQTFGATIGGFTFAHEMSLRLRRLLLNSLGMGLGDH